MAQITIEFSDLKTILDERDRLRDRVAQLEATPLAFSLEKLARDMRAKVLERGYTPDQISAIVEAIRKY